MTLHSIDSPDAGVLRRRAARGGSGRAWREAGRGGRCEIHVPISPTPAFVTKIRYLATSIRRYGGALSRRPAPSSSPSGRTSAWTSRELTLVEISGRRVAMARRRLWRRYGIYATALQRFCYEIDAPQAAVGRRHAVCGVDRRPARGRRGEPGDRGLARPHLAVHRLRGGSGSVAIHLPCRRSRRGAAGMRALGWQTLELDPDRRYCPPYFNLGVLLASREVFACAGANDLRGDGDRAAGPRYALSLSDRADPRDRSLRGRMACCRCASTFPTTRSFFPATRQSSRTRASSTTCVTRSSTGHRTLPRWRVSVPSSRTDLNSVNARLRDALERVHGRVLCEPKGMYPFIRPTIPAPDEWLELLAVAYEERRYRNFGPVASRLEYSSNSATRQPGAASCSSQAAPPG